MRTLLCAELREGRLPLDAAESHHLLVVLRAVPGTPVRLVDGRGRSAEARLVRVDGGRAELEVGRVVEAPPPPTRVVLLGAPKPALVEEAVMLATEGGATAVWLLACERAHPAAPRLERLERVVDAAVKQCRRLDRPAIEAYASMAQALAALEARATREPLARYVAQPGASGAPEGAPQGGAALAVGPEGGWSPGEREALAAAAFTPLGLGPYVLRAPTAVLAGLAALAVGRVSGW